MILKSTLAVVAVAASCFGAWKTYGAYGSVDNSLLMENIEALSGDDNGEPNDGDPNAGWPNDVCIQLKNCYFKVEVSRTKVTWPNGTYRYTTVTYEQRVKKYQVCAHVNESTKYNRCNRNKGVGSQSCINANGHLDPIPSNELGQFQIFEN